MPGNWSDMGHRMLQLRALPDPGECPRSRINEARPCASITLRIWRRHLPHRRLNALTQGIFESGSSFDGRTAKARTNVGGQIAGDQIVGYLAEERRDVCRMAVLRPERT